MIEHACGELVHAAGAAFAAAAVMPKAPVTPIHTAIEDACRMRFRFIASAPFKVALIAPHTGTLAETAFKTLS
jgi:hypothetical protein